MARVGGRKVAPIVNGGEQAREKSSGKSSDGWGNKILAALLGAVATVVFGDLVVKRNYDAMVGEWRDMKAEIAIAERDFKALDADVSDLIGSRRGITQRLDAMSRAGDVEAFMAFYPEYTAGITGWNEKRQGIEVRLRSYTGCLTESVPQAVKDSIDKLLLESRSSVNRDFLRFGDSIRRVTEHELKTYGPGARYCPSRFFFFARPDNSQRTLNDALSVFEAFQRMHDGFSDSVRYDIIACARENKDIVKAKIMGCKELPSAGAVRTCLQAAIREYSVEAMCRGSYPPLEQVGDPAFDNLDYRWIMGLKVLELYRDTYVSGRCEAKRGTWSKYLGWTCEEARADLRG